MYCTMSNLYPRFSSDYKKLTDDDLIYSLYDADNTLYKICSRDFKYISYVALIRGGNISPFNLNEISRKWVQFNTC
jgi:hypothetical protein